MRVITFPVVFPCGLTAVCLDALVIHPVSIIDEAAEDTYEQYWDEWDWDNHYVTECASLPWRCAFTPVNFSFSFLTRALFDVTESAEEARREKAAQEDGEKQVTLNLEHLQDLINSESHEEAVNQIKKLNSLINSCIAGMDDDERKELASHFQGLVLQASYKFRCYNLFYPQPWMSDVEMSSPDEQRYCLINENIKSPNALNRWIAILYCLQYPEGFKSVKIQIHKALGDKSPVVRHAALNWIQRNRFVIKDHDLLSVLLSAAKKETDSINSSLFRAILSR